MIPGTVNFTIYRGTTFGPILLRAKDGDGNAVPLTDWVPHAQVREAPQKHLVLDLNPVISDAANGELTMEFTDEETLAMVPGEFVWDLLLERPTGEILGPFLSGTFSIKTATTRT